MHVPFDTMLPTSTGSESATDGQMTLPGSRGEHLLQCVYGTEKRAARFYAEQVRDRLLPKMIEFIGRMEMVFVATADGHGDCDASLRAGPPGFIKVLDERHLAYPEYRGNGVHASLGNIIENPRIGMLMIDFERDLIGLHVNGRARVVSDAELRSQHPTISVDPTPGRKAERWVVITVDEAYIHCRKHIPRMARVHERRSWGTDDPARKGGDYFGARAELLARQAREAEDQVAVDSRPAAAQGMSVPRQRESSELASEADAVTEAPRLGEESAAQPAEESSRSRRLGQPAFPSTTHLPVGFATARPLRATARAARAGQASQRPTGSRPGALRRRSRVTSRLAAGGRAVVAARCVAGMRWSPSGSQGRALPAWPGAGSASGSRSLGGVRRGISLQPAVARGLSQPEAREASRAGSPAVSDIQQSAGGRVRRWMRWLFS